jgi:hypothetical protein
MLSGRGLRHVSDVLNRLKYPVVPKGRKEVKQFLKDLKSNDIKWKDAYKIESSRKKGKVNIFKTYEPEKRQRKGSASYGFIAV